MTGGVGGVSTAHNQHNPGGNYIDVCNHRSPNQEGFPMRFFKLKDTIETFFVLPIHFGVHPLCPSKIKPEIRSQY